MNKSLAIVDLDPILHIVANIQYSGGNMGNSSQVYQHILRFVNNIKKSSTCEEFIGIYQGFDNKNFRYDILPEYKNNRVTKEAIKIWKSTILRAFNDLGAYNVRTMESDDAINVLVNSIKNVRIVVVTGDKDFKQISTTLYNPFKKGVKANDPIRWSTIIPENAEQFLWAQTLAGDTTDMPNSLCGIPGIGIIKGLKALNKKPYLPIIQEMYTVKFGATEGLKRALRTYRMVRLLNGTNADRYAGKLTLSEIQYLKNNYRRYVKLILDPLSVLFEFKEPNSTNLFKN